MNELTLFTEKLSACDLIALTPINEGRFYCRFYSNRLYFDRMFVKDASLQEELMVLSEGDEIIDKDSVDRLKEKYIKEFKVTDEEEMIKSADSKS